MESGWRSQGPVLGGLGPKSPRHLPRLGCGERITWAVPAPDGADMGKAARPGTTAGDVGRLPSCRGTVAPKLDSMAGRELGQQPPPQPAAGRSPTPFPQEDVTLQAFPPCSRKLRSNAAYKLGG